MVRIDANGNLNGVSNSNSNVPTYTTIDKQGNLQRLKRPEFTSVSSTKKKKEDESLLESGLNKIKDNYKTTLSILFPAFNVVNTGSKIVDSIKNNDGKIVHENELMKDGYDTWDVTKTILGTAGDLAGNFVSGIANTGEGIGDLISYGRAGINRALGNDEKADKIIEDAKDNAIQLTWDYIRDKTGISKSSVAGTKTNEIAQGLGNVATMIATGNLGAAAGLGSKGTTVATSLVTGTSSMGSGMSEAYQGGATDEEALKYGIISGVAEAGTELMFGGLGKWNNAVGISKSAIGLDDAVAKKVASKFKSQLAKNLAQYTIKAGAEGVEELVSGIIQGFGKWLTYRSEDELVDIMKDEQLLDQFISGMIISGISSAPGLVKTTSQGRDYVTGRTQNEQSVVDKEVQNRVAEQEKDGKKLSTKEINAITEQVESDLGKGYISTKTIEDTLGMQNYVDNLVQDFENKSGKQVTNEEYKLIYDEARKQFMQDIQSKDGQLIASYEEDSKRTQKFDADLSKYGKEQRDMIQKAIDSGILNNTNRTHEFVDFISKIASDRGITFDFTNNDNLKNSGFAVDGKVVNGYVNANGDITLNIDGNKSLNSVVGHEITHVLEGTDLYNALSESIKEYAETKGEYQKRLKELTDLYKDVENADVTKELTADLVGDYLFTNQDFVNHLTQNRNLFQKIFDEIKYMLKQVTSGSQEERQLSKAMKMFEKAYRDSGIKNAVKEGNQFSLTKATNEQINKAEKLEKQNKSNEEIYLETGAYRGADGLWRSEIDDSDAKITLDLYYHTGDNGQQYKLKDILDHPKLYEAYPEFKDLNVFVGHLPDSYYGFVDEYGDIYVDESNYDIQQQNIERLENIYNNLNKDIEISKMIYGDKLDDEIKKIEKKISSFDYKDYQKDFKSTLLHEIQHKIQKKEGFATGTNTEETKRAHDKYMENIRELNSTLSELYEKSGIGTQWVEDNMPRVLSGEITMDQFFDEQKKARLKSKVGSLIEQKLKEKENYEYRYGVFEREPYDLYKNTAGEIEAREVQKRMNYTPEERSREIPFYKDENTLFAESRLNRKYNIVKNSDVKYSLSVSEANTTEDNNGNKLSKEQIDYFKDSKAVDENGNLITVYHTTTDEVPQFNEFNPVGTPYYKFGDQVVNYYTDSKNMSGSYANQKYEMADTTKLENMKDIEKYLHNTIIKTGNNFAVEQNENGIYELKQEKQVSKDAKKFVESLTENQMQQMIDNIYYDEDMAGTNYEKSFSWDKFDKNLQKKYNDALNKYMGTNDLVDMQLEIMKYLNNPNLMAENYLPNGEIIQTYNTEDELLRNIKSDIQKSNWTTNTKLQYEGYVNITNPYIIDAEKRNWNQVVSESNQFIDDLDSTLKKSTKDKLTNLYFESERKNDIAKTHYEIINNLINRTDEFLDTNKNTQNMKRILNRVGLNNIKSIIDGHDTGLGVSTYYNLADVLNETGVIGESTSKLIVDDFKVPEEVQKWLKNNFNKKMKLKDISPRVNEYNKAFNVKDSISLKEIYETESKAFDEFEKYRTPYNYFIEEYSKDNSPYVDLSLEDLLETRAETIGADAVLEELAQASSVGFNKSEMIRLWGVSKTTNDIVKEVIASNQDKLTDYDGVIIKNVFDYGGKPSIDKDAHDVYVTFNSNQFKAIDNENPTEDPDIRYSLSQQNEEIAPVKNPNLTYGEDIKYRDAVEEEIAPVRQEVSNLNTRIDEIRREYDDKEKELRNELESLKALREDYQRENQSLTEEQVLARDEELRGYTPEYIPEEQIEQGYSPVTALDDKTLNKYVKHFKNDFKLNAKQTREFTDMVRQLSANPELTKKDVANYIYKNFGKEEIKTLNEDVNEIRSELRNTLIGVPENVKEEIASTHDGYGKFRKKYFGKLKLGDYNGTNAIDQIYKQLAEQYPNVFNEEITSNPTDQLLQLAEITDMDRYYSVFEELPKEYVDGYVNELYSMIKDYRKESTLKLLENEKIPDSYYDNMAVEEFEDNTYENLENRINQLEDELAILPAERQQKETAVKNIDNFNNVEPTIQPDKKDIMELFDAQRQRNEGKKTELVKPVIAKEKGKLRTTIDTLKSALVNENTEIDNLAKESGNNNIKFAGDMLNNYTGEAQYDIEAAQTDINGNEITYEDGKKAKSVNQLFQPAKDKGLDVIFNDLLFHYSNVDRWRNGKGSQTPMDISQKQIADYEAKFPELRQWAEDVWKYGENARKNMVDAGLITQDLSNYLAETYPHYVPYISDVSNFDSLAESMNELRAKGLKRAKGGSGQILPIQEALARYTISQKGAIRRNNMYREIVNTLSAIDGVANSTPDARSSDLTNLDNNVFRDDKGDYFLTAYIDGEEKTVKITESLFKGIRKDMANHVRDFENKLSAILNPVQKVSNVRRKLLTTWSPTFLVKNVVKDIQDGLFNSKHTGGLVKNYIPGIVELVKNNTPEVRQFKALYGTDALRGQYEDALYNTDGKAKNKKFLKGLMSANEIMELAPRYAEFKASLQAGESVEQAMYNAREVTTNFSRGGTITKALNRNGFTFLNANVQGFDKFIRNFSGENGAKGIVNSLIKAVALGIAPAVLNELAFGLGDDKDEDYDALPDYIKDNYYLIKTGDGNFIRIPKGRMLSVFGSAGRRTLELAQGEEDAFEGYLSNVNNQIGISNPEENNIFAPLIQAYGSENGTAWYGGDIVPSRLQDKPAEEQYDASTDKMSIWLGDKLGISPYKLNYVIDQYTGGIGDLVLPMITDEAKSDGSLLAPIKDQFTADSTTDNKYVSDFYDKKDELYVKSNGSKATDEDKVKEQYLYDISKEMGKLYAERRDVQADNSLSKEEKYKKAQEIKKVINKLAKDGLDTYEKVEVTGNYASVNDKDFYKNAKGNWTEVKDDEKEKVDSMGLTNHEKDSYFTTSNEIYEINQKWKDINDSSAIKKKEIINSIIKADIPDEAKASLYDKNYASTDTLNAVLGCGIDFNSYLDLQAQNFSADKDDNGKSINGSKKAKIYDYINDMNIPYEKKIMLAKLEYPSDNRYNYEIIDELNNDPSITYQDMSDILKAMGFKVDIYGNITW